MKMPFSTTFFEELPSTLRFGYLVLLNLAAQALEQNLGLLVDSWHVLHKVIKNGPRAGCCPRI